MMPPKKRVLESFAVAIGAFYFFLFVFSLLVLFTLLETVLHVVLASPFLPFIKLTGVLSPLLFYFFHFIFVLSAEHLRLTFLITSRGVSLREKTRRSRLPPFCFLLRCLARKHFHK